MFGDFGAALAVDCEDAMTTGASAAAAADFKKSRLLIFCMSLLQPIDNWPCLKAAFAVLAGSSDRERGKRTNNPFRCGDNKLQLPPASITKVLVSPSGMVETPRLAGEE